MLTKFSFGHSTEIIRQTLISDLLSGIRFGPQAECCIQAGKILNGGRMNCCFVIFGHSYVNKNIYILNLHVCVEGPVIV